MNFERSKNPDAVRLGANLKTFRKNRGHTREQFCKLLGCELYDLKRYETGETPLPTARIFQVLKLGCRSEDLFSGIGSRQQPAMIDDCQ